MLPVAMLALSITYKEMTMTLDNPSQPVVLLFSGRGNPVIGMGSDLWISMQRRNRSGIVPAMCRASICADSALSGPMNRLIQTTVQQLAVTAINVSLYSLCRERFPALRVGCLRP